MFDFDEMENIQFYYKEPETVRYEDVDSVLSDFEKDVEAACIKLFKESEPRKFGEDFYVNALDVWEAMGNENFPVSKMVAAIEKAIERMENIEVEYVQGEEDSDDYCRSVGRLLNMSTLTHTMDDEPIEVQWNLMEPYRAKTIKERQKFWEETLARLEE